MASTASHMCPSSSPMLSHEVEEVTPCEAWEMLARDRDAELIDVRTLPEWQFVGYPNMSSLDKKLHQISWVTYPHFERNKNFVDQVKAIAPNPETPLYFICRTGGRSFDAALAMMQEAGYRHCFNVLEGFEGSLNDTHHRGAANGWKASQLPWEQA